MASIWFTGNCEDLSTDRGYQFTAKDQIQAKAKTVSVKKRCSKCGADADGNPKFCPECRQKCT
jgi:membrane protease subunit (stomatin/prohibitin family)